MITPAPIIKGENATQWVEWQLNTVTRQLWSLLVNNGIQLANDGWGGLENSETTIYISPTLSKGNVANSIAPLIQFGQGLVDAKVVGSNLVITTFSSYGTFFNFLAASKVVVSYC